MLNSSNKEPKLLLQNLKSALSNYSSSDKDEGRIIHPLTVKAFDPKYVDSQGKSHLHLAAAEGKIEVVKFLLEKKMDPNCQEAVSS